MRNAAHTLPPAALLLLLLALLASGTAGAQTAPLFQLYSPDPVVPHGTGDVWDSPYTDPGAVFYYNGMFHMFRNGFRAWPASVQWGYVTSPDGYTWTKQGDAPVFMTNQVPYAGDAALASSVLVLDDGTWVIYFYTYGDGGDRTGNWSIGRATAPGPTGPWKADPAPVLTPGPADSWDPKLSSPSVIRTADGYAMYFDGGDPVGTSMLGMATSKDGMHWAKYNDPATGGPFAESDPILQPSTDAWDRIALDHPRVVQAPQGWVMLYRSAQRRPGGNALGYALSSDGVHWARAAANPILSWRLIPGGDGVYYCDLVYHDGTFFVLWEVTKGNSSQIYLATHQGTLPTDTASAPVATPPPAISPTAPPTSAVPTAPELPGNGSQTFAETGKSLAGVFLDYWKSHAVAQLGAPISDLAREVSDLNGQSYTVQYFNGSLLEYHPENAAPFNVLLAHLGRFEYRKKYPTGAPAQQANGSPGAVHFTETGHSLGGPFLDYWRQTGGLMQHGFPISDELDEVSPLDGKTYTTQYFERAVFEYHPEKAGRPGVVLARPLGAVRYQLKSTGQ